MSQTSREFTSSDTSERSRLTSGQKKASLIGLAAISTGIGFVLGGPVVAGVVLGFWGFAYPIIANEIEKSDRKVSKRPVAHIVLVKQTIEHPDFRRMQVVNNTLKPSSLESLSEVGDDMRHIMDQRNAMMRRRR